jgi:hypothetical protein
MDFTPPDPLGTPAFLRVVVAMLIKRLGVAEVEFGPDDLDAIRGHVIQAGARPDGCAVRLVPPEPEGPLIIVPTH